MSLQKAKLQEAIEFVHREAAAGATATDLHNAFFGIGAKLGELFPSRSEREAFRNTAEYEQIKRIRASLREKERVASS